MNAVLVTLYVVTGLALAIAPTIHVILSPSVTLRVQIARVSSYAIVATACLLVGVAIGMIAGAAFLTGSLLLSIGMATLASKDNLDRLGTFFCSLAAAGASGTLLWWKYDQAHVLTIKVEYVACFFIVVFVVCLGMSARPSRNRTIELSIAVLISAFILQHCLNVSVLRNSDLYETVRHHWGAYIGPSETFLSGARVLYDIPAQYGLGPTLLIASACGENCWVGMYWITTLTSIIYVCIVLASACVLGRTSCNTWAFGLILLTASAAGLFWTSYPPLLGAPSSFPSTGGLRFIPLSTLLLFILWRESRSDERLPRRSYGHALWCFGAIWSPEAAFYSSFVWWPYLLWSATRSGVQPFRSAVLACGEALVVTLAFLTLSISIYYLIYGVTPSLDVYAAYVANLTGPLPVNPRGSIWFFVFTITAGISAAVWLIRSRSHDREFANVFVCLLSLYAVFSYYLGRSHDNNILNLMPFMVLVLIAVQNSPGSSALSHGAHVALASTVALVAFFGWSAWHVASLSDYANADAAVSMSYVRGRTAEQTGAADQFLSVLVPDRTQNSEGEHHKSRLDGGDAADAAQAVFYVSSIRHEPLIKIDDSQDIAPIGPRAWSAIHDPVNFYYLPDALVATLIDRTMRRIKSPGWLIIARHVEDLPETLRWQRLLEGSYVRTGQMIFGSYRAVRYEPKL